MRKRLLSAVLSVSLSITMICGSSFSVFAANNGYTVNNRIRSTVKICGHKTYDFNFDFKNLISGSNTKYSQEISDLAILLSSELPSTKESTSTTATAGKIAILNDDECILDQLGFTDIRIKDIRDKADSYSVDKDDFAGFHMGRRVVREGANKYVVYVLAVRGTFFLREWISNVDTGSSNSSYGTHPEWTNHKMHKGFNVTANRIMEELDKYINEHSSEDRGMKKSVLITGHSRGAAVANIIGKEYEDRYNRSKDIKPYTYTFGTPRVSLESKSKLRSYKTIFNIVNKDDGVTYLPLKSWGYERYGRDIEFSINSSPALKKSWLYKKYATTMNDLRASRTEQLRKNSVVELPDLKALSSLLPQESYYASANGDKVDRILTEFFQEDGIINSREFLYTCNIPAWIPKDIDADYKPYYVNAEYPSGQEAIYKAIEKRYECKYVNIAPFFFFHALDSNMTAELAGENAANLNAFVELLGTVNSIAETGRLSLSTVKDMSELAKDFVSRDVKNIFVISLAKTPNELYSTSVYIKMLIDVANTDFFTNLLNSHHPLAYYFAMKEPSARAVMQKTADGFRIKYNR